MSFTDPGLLFIVGFEGTSAPAWVLQRLREGRLGGVILFARNFERDPALLVEQAAALVGSFGQQAAPDRGAAPPIVSIDQEGGRVQRLKDPFTVFPPMLRLAGRGAGLARRVGQALGAELAALGINLDYAPVLDVHTNPDNPIIGDRALATAPAEAAELALGFLDGLEASGVRGCGKHFPGHGDTEQDSHLTLPRVDAGRQRLFDVELLPFAAAARHGIGMLMTAHVVYPVVDPRPATLSPVWLTDILRGQLGYEGVILSDDLDMRALADRDAGAAIVDSLLAGCDAFLLCKDAERQERAAEALRQAAERSGRVRERMAESAARLLRFRQTLRWPRPDRDRLARLPDREHQELAASFR